MASGRSAIEQYAAARYDRAPAITTAPSTRSRRISAKPASGESDTSSPVASTPLKRPRTNTSTSTDSSSETAAMAKMPRAPTMPTPTPAATGASVSAALRSACT